MAKRKDVGLKGNIWWAPSYALTTIRNHRVRNIGIALILAISVSIPTTVFIWTATGTEIAVDDYFDENAYQMYLRSETDTGNYSHLEAASEYALASPFTEYSDVVSSSVCILQGDWPDWELYYYQAMLQYAMGIKDGRMIFVTNEVLEAASGELEYEGSFSLELGQVIVSRFFAETAALVHNITVEIGSQISLDLLQTAPIYNPHESDFRPPEELGRTRITNVTVVGIYEIAGLSTLAEMFPSFSRKNWDPFALAGDPVLGINDAVLVLQDQVDETVLENVNNRGYFSPVGLVRASKSGLMEAGIGRVSTHLFGLQAQIQERFPNVRVTALDEILDLNMHIQLYLQSQVLVVLALPVMIMSLMLTIFTSETSISYRRGEISALRAKGASFNQIFSAVIWESMILAIAGFAIGTLLSFMTAPLMEASTGLLTFDFTIYEKFLLNTVIPLQALVLGASVALFLPSAYLLHVARRIDVSEVGQPTSRTYYEVPEETNVWYYALGLGAVLTILVIMPSLLTPVGSTALLEVVIATILLFVASYLGSRAMRLVTAKASGGSGVLLGQKSLYVTQSLKRRKGQFIPLLLLLTLTLATTTMSLIQTESVDVTLNGELDFAIGADMRIETDGTFLNVTETISEFSSVEGVAAVLETPAMAGTDQFFIEGIDPTDYLDVGYFKQGNFIGGTPQEILSLLETTENGIIISEYYSRHWNHPVGDLVSVSVITHNGTTMVDFQIVGLVRSAPGFGISSTTQLEGYPFGAFFGFQVGRGGFALTNLDFLAEITEFETVNMFLVDLTSYDDANPLIAFLKEDKNTKIYTPETMGITDIPQLALFISGVRGMTAISFMFCAAMGLTAIGLFLGSAVSEREPEYAVFKALGATNRQVVMMVFGEFAGVVVAAIGISLLLGIVFGYVLTALTLGISSIFPLMPHVLSFPFTVMVFTIVLEFIVMVMACYIPARRAGRTDPAKVLRNL